MGLYLFILLIFSPGLVSALSKSCSAQFCDPNWTPFDNMVSGLRGYNIRSGNPVQNHGDPGFGGQIFLPTKINDLGRIELEAGITASELSHCQRSMTSKSFTTMDSYRKYVATSSSSGVDLQVGTDTEVTAGVNLKGVDLSAKKVIPKPFERSWGDSRDFKQLTSFFSQKHGLVSVAMGICTMYEMKIDRYHLPPFTVSFSKALIDLFNKRKLADPFKRAAFRRFVKEYGTHFLIRTKLGAQYIYRTKFSESARNKFDSETLKKCSYVKGSKIFGIQVEKSKTKCSESDLQKMNNLQSSEMEVSIITKGSRPTDIKSWATQDFTPIPLQFELSPIINLMADRYINHANIKTTNGEKVTGMGIRKWFVPMYFDYCKSMGIDCGYKEGCGINDKCPLDAVCVPGGKKHECSNWGQWSCVQKCGQGTQMRRTRRCVGCKGTEQVVNRRCPPLKECYNHHPSCNWKYTPWNDGNSNVHYLDRHRLDCGNHHSIKYFALVRDGKFKNYRYKYQCCQTQLRCHSSGWRNSRATYVNGDRDFYYLDRQQVTCPNDGLIMGFQLKRQGRNDVYYNFRCCTMPQPKTCTIRHTGFTYDGKGNTVYLDRQRPSCPSGYGMNSFRLLRDSGGRNVRYRLRCCKIRPN